MPRQGAEAVTSSGSPSKSGKPCFMESAVMSLTRSRRPKSRIKNRRVRRHPSGMRAGGCLWGSRPGSSAPTQGRTPPLLGDRRVDLQGTRGSRSPLGFGRGSPSLSSGSSSAASRRDHEFFLEGHLQRAGRIPMLSAFQLVVVGVVPQLLLHDGRKIGGSAGHASNCVGQNVGGFVPSM